MYSSGRVATVALGVASVLAALATGSLGWLLYAFVAVTVVRDCLRKPRVGAYSAIGIAAGFYLLGHTMVWWDLSDNIAFGAFMFAYGFTIAAGVLITYGRVQRIEHETLLELFGLIVVGVLLLGTLIGLRPASGFRGSILAQVLALIGVLLISVSSIGRRKSREMAYWGLAAFLSIVVEVVDSAFGGQGDGLVLLIVALPYLPIIAASRMPDRGEFLAPSHVPARRAFGFRQMLFTALFLAVPSIAVAHFARSGTSGELVAVLLGSGAVAVIAALRVRLLVGLRDWSFDQETELRTLGADLVAVDDPEAARTRVLEAIRAVVGAEDEIAILGPNVAEVLAADVVVPERARRSEVSDETSNYEWWRRTNDWADYQSLVPVGVKSDPDEFLAIAGSGKESLELPSLLDSIASLYALKIKGDRTREDIVQKRFAQRFRSLAQDSGDVVFVIDPIDRSIKMVGPSVERLLGFTEEEFTALDYFSIVHSNDRSAVRDLFSRSGSSVGVSESIDIRIKQSNSLYAWFSLSIRSLADTADIQGIVFSMTDIHTRKLAEIQTGRSESLYRMLVNQTSDVFVVTDSDNIITFATPNIEEVLGFPAAELFGTDPVTLFTSESGDRLISFVEENNEDLIGKTLEVQGTTKWGQTRDIELKFCDPGDGLDGGSVVQVRDISERKELEARLAERPYLDLLTELPLRDATYSQIGERLRGLGGGEELSVLVIDARGPVNGTLGSMSLEHGDTLMLGVVQRIRDLVRECDLVSRIDAFEIAIVSAGARGDRMTFLWSRIQDELDLPYSIEGGERRMKLSVGCYRSTDRTESPQEVLEAAHIALGVARENSGSSIVFFEPEMRSRLAERLALERALGPAIANNEFFVAYQPLIDLPSMKVKSVEALMRWDHPGRGLVSPGDFIPISEDSGQIVDLGRFVMAEACREVRNWNVTLPGADQLCVSVNVSMRQLQEPNETQTLIDIISTSGIDPANLIVELTESILVEDPQWLRANLAPFQNMGCSIAVDDFGTGAAGLSQLREIRFDFLKIDKSYIDRVGTRGEGTKLVEGVVELGHRVGAAIVAEGIESPKQARLLREMGCEIGQGFFFAKPMSPERFPTWLAEDVNVFEDTGSRSSGQPIR